MRFLRALRGAVKLQGRQCKGSIGAAGTLDRAAARRPAPAAAASSRPRGSPARVLAVGEGPARAQVHPSVPPGLRAGRRRLCQAQLQPLHSRPRHHHAVVGAQPRRRAHQVQASFLRHRPQPPPDVLVAGHAARHHEMTHLQAATAHTAGWSGWTAQLGTHSMPATREGARHRAGARRNMVPSPNVATDLWV